MALDPLAAWLGTPDRRLGVLGLATMAAAFLAGQGVTSQRDRRPVGRAGAVALGGMTVYGIAEAAGWAPIDLTTTTPRLGSTFGSAAYLGAALCLLGPIAVGTALDPGESRGWRYTATAAGAGAAFLLMGSATRAALIGLVAAALFSMPTWWSRRRGALAALVVAVLVGVALAVPSSRRLLQPEMEGRLAEWRVGSTVLADRPLTGTGLEGYRIAFPRHVDIDYVGSYGRATVTDRAHSGPLDMGIALGAAGTLAWVAAAGWLVVRAWRVARTSDPLLTGMAAGVVALLAQELFLFPTLEVGVAGWAVAGVVVAAGPAAGRVRVRSSLAAGGALVISLAALAAGAADVTADHLAAAARRDHNVDLADRAGSLRPDSFRYPLLAADLALSSGRIGAALDRVDDAMRLSPSDPGLRLARARVIAALVADGHRSPGRGATALAGMVEDDPHHPELRLLHGDLLAEAGAAEQAERAWLAASHLAPGRAEPELRLASLYHRLGEMEAAREALERARSRQDTHPDIARLEEAIEGA